jgi:hypothetical protein
VNLRFTVTLFTRARLHDFIHPAPPSFINFPSTFPFLDDASLYAWAANDWLSWSSHFIGKMSTFKGVIEEFPEIRVDFFRTYGRRPLSCFLSHIHSDHLAGLENPNFNAPL